MNILLKAKRKPGKWKVHVLRSLAIMMLLGICVQGPVAEAAANKAVVSGNTSAKSKVRTLSSTALTKVVQKVNPSVVTIVGQDMDALAEGYSPEESISYGSGVVYREDGWIITNGHVMERLKKPLVVTQDGKKYHVTKFFYDEAIDIAVVKINAKGLKPASYAASAVKPEVGEEVLAFGTPLSIALRNSVSRGIISGVDRSLDGGYKLLQTDASINPGNSGGPLVNVKGEVIGINTLKYYGEEVDNVGFAIPIDTVRWAVSDLIHYGEVRRGVIGIELEQSWGTSMALPSNEPLKVTAVSSKSAELAGIRKGDALYSIDGKAVGQLSDVREALKGKLQGERVKLGVGSNGKKRTVTLKLG
ncbi:S1C family serine protease [Paenibacillus sp. 1001270B_150601_E10]|uniref:S1C family serine protease n=1 Tax=Paenibacillus sp. 1001270B_150601_E10 TaxID=2787079 RepID=UPI0018A03F8D|nr:trypsin-like peptidase domain-containing protein [Paenibacillus sp. 1001270B_150601_E10]